MGSTPMFEHQIQQCATGQSGMTGWKTADCSGQVRRGQAALDRQGRPLGTVESIEGDWIRLTAKDGRGPRQRRVPASQVLSVEGNEVRLTC